MHACTADVYGNRLLLMLLVVTLLANKMHGIGLPSGNVCLLSRSVFQLMTWLNENRSRRSNIMTQA